MAQDFETYLHTHRDEIEALTVYFMEARLDAIETLSAEIDASLTRAEVLRQSFLKRAFAGELVPQDPTDEPASALLARIKAKRVLEQRKPIPRKRRATHR